MTPVLDFIKLCRFYRAQGPALVIGFYPAQGKEILDGLAQSGNVITLEEVQKMASVLPFPAPSAAIRHLADSLNFMRVTVHAKDAVPAHLQTATDRVEKYVAGLLKELPILIKAGRQLNTPKSNATAEGFEAFLSAVQVFDHYSPHGAPGAKPWHDDATYLAFVVEDIASQAGSRVSFTKPTAPAVIFIDRALKRAGVRHGTPEAIARALARRKASDKIKMASSDFA